jgi:alpha-beta hydrolase superfamily lysophospholipase
MVAAIKERRGVAEPLIFTGHSKGGALAMLASCLCDVVSAVVSFSAPRPGDQAFAESMRFVSRWEYGLDIVPHLPPSFPLRALLEARCRPMRLLDDYSYASAGTLSYVNGGTVVADSAMLRLKRQLALAKAIVTGQAEAIIAAHSLTNYGSAIGV